MGGTSTTQTIVWTLDAAGNKTRETSAGSATNASYDKTFTLDNRDRVTAVAVTGANAGTATYTYDANGNLTGRSLGGQNRVFTWNARDRLVEVKQDGASLAQYRYNAEGLRDEILSQPNGNRRTTWVDGFAYLDKDTNDNLIGQYEAQANGRSPLLINGAQGAEYLMSDALGSTTLSTGPSGTALSQTRYDAWGNAETQAWGRSCGP